ncbi:DinB family protein [Planctomycetales bacterium 10988]|nr:DinB family protein [Planctomycetales bacterium 10988]
MKEQYLQHLIQTREFTEKLLEVFQKEEDWIYQVHPEANHALWFIGHLAHTDDFFISLIEPEKKEDTFQATEMFGMGSQPVADLSAYPPIDEVRSRMKERREVLLDVLSSLTEEDLKKETPPGTPEFLKNYESVFQTAIWHEGMHSGQLTVTRRALGHPPIRDGRSSVSMPDSK